MSWLKRNSFLGALILATTMIVGLESWLLWQTRLDASRALTGLDQKKREREDLQQRLPQPTAETARMLADEFAGTSAKLLDARAAISKRAGRTATPTPVKSIDAYFEIARFVETERAAARRLNIAIRSDEHFGFSSHASEGPHVEILSAVLGQRAAVEKLIDALFTAGPVALIGVQRERPVAILQRKSQDQARLGKSVGAKPETHRDEPADFFDPVYSISLRATGKIEANAFRVEFSGQTTALRNYLNALAGSEMPFFVRSVEVEPLADLPKTTIASGASSAPVPIVTNSLSRFRVTIELLESVDEIEGTAR
ncbi:MAG TPA: Amuc_1100 family pilus-like protein [Lacunisphaera sp.]|jgi:hypothetical protein